MKVDKGSCELYMDGYLKKNLDFFIERVGKDWDFVGICIGNEGDGKTTMIKQECLYIDPTFNINKCVFNVDQFMDAVENLPNGSAIMWDESDELDATNLRRILLAIKRKFKRIRKKNMFIWLVTPTFFDLNKYFIMHRVQCLINVYSVDTERGYFEYYSQPRLRQLYIRGRKEWDMNVAKADFRGRFTKCPAGFPISDDEYEAKKDAATADVSDESNVREKQAQKMQQITIRLRNYLMRKFKHKPTYNELADILGLHKTSIGGYIRSSLADKDKKIMDVKT